MYAFAGFAIDYQSQRENSNITELGKRDETVIWIV